MNEEIVGFVDLLEGLLDEVPFKAKVEIEIAINMINGDAELGQEDLIKFAEQLEMISNLTNIDSFARSEILNILSDIEGLL